MKESSSHHFVPRVYLKYFATKRKSNDYFLYVYDKMQNKTFPRNICDIGYGKNYNRVHNGKYLPAVPDDNVHYYEKKFQENLEILKKYDKSEVFTIAGRKFYKNGIDLTPGMPLKLVKEPDNESDRDAIAVYTQNEKVGYVANKDYTKFELTSLASELQERIENDAQAKYLFYLDRYAEIQFHIARIVK